jgi:hypothetical protein
MWQYYKIEKYKGLDRCSFHGTKNEFSGGNVSNDISFCGQIKPWTKSNLS